MGIPIVGTSLVTWNTLRSAAATRLRPRDGIDTYCWEFVALHLAHLGSFRAHARAAHRAPFQNCLPTKSARYRRNDKYDVAPFINCFSHFFEALFLFVKFFFKIKVFYIKITLGSEDANSICIVAKVIFLFP